MTPDLPRSIVGILALPTLLLATALPALAQESVVQDSAPTEGVPDIGDFPDLPDFFDTDPITEVPPIEIHGTIDLTLILFDSERNLDGYPEDRLTLLEPKILLVAPIAAGTRFMAEVEADGVDVELEVERFGVVHDIGPGREIEVGIFTIPFGIERYYYSSARNPLVDRPSPFRRVFPGTYADAGVRLHVEERLDEDWSIVVEGAVTRSLEGPSRTDRPDPLDEFDQVAPSGRIGFVHASGLRFGGSGLWARYDDGFGDHEELTLHGLDVSLHHGETMVRAEVVWGRVGRAAAAGGDYDRYGWYAEISHRFLGLPPWGKAFEGVIRYDDVDADDSVRDDQDVRRWAFGWNWVFDDRWRLKTEVSLSREDGESVANDGRFIQLEYHF